MATRPTVSAEHLRAYRIVRTGLLRSSPVETLRLWELGVQERDGAARHAVAVRAPDPAVVPDRWPEPGSRDTDHALVWSLRGAPHIHWRADLPTLAGQLRPPDEHRAATELVGDSARLRSSGGDPLAAIDAVVTALRAVVTAPMTKGDASTAVTAAIPDEYATACRSCGTTHVLEQLFRRCALPAGIGLVPDTKPVQLAPIRPAVRQFQPSEQRADLTKLVAAYYTVYGAGSAGDVAAFLGTSSDTVIAALPKDLTAATVAGRRALATADLLDGVAHPPAEAGSVVRLLPATDPFLAARDRQVLVTDADARATLWPVIGPPGAVLAAGSIVGSWRTKLRGRRLSITVTPFGRLTPTVARALEPEAELVAAMRGAADVEIAVAG